MKVLLAVDGSKFTKKMLAYLTTHETLLSSQHHQCVLLNVQPALPARAVAAIGNDTVRTYHAEEAERVLAPVVEFLKRHHIQAEHHWEVGHASERIAQFAEDGKFDLVVMGSHGHGTLINLVLGSVATQVLARCKVPVLLVR